MEPAEITGAAIAKRLASCNQSSRNRAVRLLSSWLPNQLGDPSTAAGVSDGELVKIWKGLFFCVWHSDKLPAQVELINCLAALLSSLPPALAGRYLDAFLVTIRREWSGIDYFRLDKFYLLIRRFLRHFFLLLSKNSWDPELTAHTVGILSRRSLVSLDMIPASGVNYHISEIFLDEIVEFLPLASGALQLLLKPFFTVLQTKADKVLVYKIKFNIFDRLAENGAALLNGAESGSDVEKLGKIALFMGFSKIFFELASASDTQQSNRKVLFALYEKYLKLEKDHEKSGINFSLENLDVGNSLPESEATVKASQVLAVGNVHDDRKDEPEESSSWKKKLKAGRNASDVIEKKGKEKGQSVDSFIKSNGTHSEKKSKSRKKKKKLKKLTHSGMEGNGAEATLGGTDASINSSNCVGVPDNGDGDSSDSRSVFAIDGTLLSNLQKKFEIIAAEAGLASSSKSFSTPANGVVAKKRKRAKSADAKRTLISAADVDEEGEAGKSEDRGIKKVRFSMKNNLIWKPQNPLPPQDLRLPPSVIPRGSAMKKGVSPGPIKETPPSLRKIKVKGSSVKKGRKTLKTLSPTVKRLRMLQSLSA
ncbi:hypothetical protein AXF42_Ash017306 [Apostasia shenzhenica]|uniref:Ribosomal RNA processing protein 1 like n=1 Tax=Apostasia shenzhenica TaxID=1088818 RepID=A0A2I0BDA2_9ASPA|nr:hypothetical protein AXF42_Ash017306 [Apostasia shenzhenica]